MRACCSVGVFHCKCVCITSCRLRLWLSSSAILSSESSWFLSRFCSLSFRRWFCFLVPERVSRALSSCSCTHTKSGPVFFPIFLTHSLPHFHPNPVFVSFLFIHLNSAEECLEPQIVFFFFLLAWSDRSRANWRWFIPSAVFLFAQHL